MFKQCRKQGIMSVLAFTLLMALALSLVGAVPVYADGPNTPVPPQEQGSRVLGVVHAKGGPHQVAAEASDAASKNAAFRFGNLAYHNGPVMHTNTAYAIYWFPSGSSYSSNYQNLIDGFFKNVAADNGKSSNVYYSDTQYYDNVNSNILYSSAFGGSVVDTNSFPPSGCSDSYTSVCLSDAQLQAEVQRVMSAQGWTGGTTHVFFIFTPRNVGSCAGSSCAFSTFCAYHSWIGSGSNAILYANQPYADWVSAACDAGQHPNGDDADATINVVSHEHNEAITDEQGSAWYDRTGNENGDKCAWNFGTALGNTGSGLYNQVIGTGKYYLQREWSNKSSRCVLTGQ